ARLPPGLTGRRFVGVEIDDARLTRPFEPRAVAAALEGETVAAVERRGKYLVVRFESGRSLLIHLRMTGSLLHAERGTLADDPHRRAVVRLDDGSDVAYRDVRRFGTWLLVEPEELEPYLATRLGGERPCATTRRPTVGVGACSTSSRCMAATANPAIVAERRSRRRASPVAGRGTARTASRLGPTTLPGVRRADRPGRAARARCSRRSVS